MAIKELKNKKYLITGAASGIDSDHEDVIKLKKRFTDQAVSPDSVASIIIKDIKLMNWFKRKIFLMYHIIRKILSSVMIRVLNNAHS